jgi:hypothetical protein
MLEHRTQDRLVRSSRIEQTEFFRRRILVAQHVARTHLHRGQQFFQLRSRPADLAIQEHGRPITRRLDHRERVARRTAIGIVVDGDREVTHCVRISLMSQPKKATPAIAPAICAATNKGTLAGAMPANVSDRLRATVTAGLAKQVEAVNQ